MTTKERDSEMLEIFKRKSALSDKITANTNELSRIDAEIDRVDLRLKAAKNITAIYRYRLELKRIRGVGRKLVIAQKGERRKLSFTAVSKQLNVNRTHLHRQYLKFLSNQWFFESVVI